MTPTPTPEFLPVLSQGSHDNPQKGACLMEYVSLLAGEPFSDTPICVDSFLAAIGRRVNDQFDPQYEGQDRSAALAPLIPRFIGTRQYTDEGTIRLRLRYVEFAVLHTLARVQAGTRDERYLDTIRLWQYQAHRATAAGDVGAMLSATMATLRGVDATVATLTRILEIAEDEAGTSSRPLHQADVEAIQGQLT